MTKIENTKTPIVTQIILGFLFAALNLGVKFLQDLNPIPLYMDTIFTIAASFFGGLCGSICATLHHVVCSIIVEKNASGLVWSLCSYTVVLIIRLYVRKRKKQEFLDILLIIFIMAIIISIEGALIFTVMNVLNTYREESQVRFMYSFLSRNNLPVFVSALLPRVPVNILDKGICVSLGYLCHKGIKKLLTAARKA
ncbi:MAG: hypothetical protein K5930_12525 [Treponemataceae bacterium]|nr:hypothetical protein [Treponemataceae bacterium]